MTAPEKQLEAILRVSMAMTWGQRHYFRKTHGSMFTGAGTPDFVGHIYGASVELELKVHPGQFSQQQKNNITEVARTGGFTGGIMQYETYYYYLFPSQVGDFSYRHRPKWIPLPLIRVPTRNGLENRLNLMPLTIMVMNHIAAIKTTKHQEEPNE